MVSVGLWEIPKVVDSTAQGPKTQGRHYWPLKVFPITPQKPWVNQSVVHLCPLVTMHSMLAQWNACGGPGWPTWTMYIASTQSRPQNPQSKQGVDCRAAEAHMYCGPAGAGVEHGGWKQRWGTGRRFWRWKEAGEGRAVCGKESHEAEEKACRASCHQAGHTLCVQSSYWKYAQLHRACRGVIRSWGNQEWFVVVLIVMLRIVLFVFCSINAPFLCCFCFLLYLFFQAIRALQAVTSLLGTVCR